MKPADWDRVKDLFEAALRLPAAERNAFVSVQTSDAELLAELRSLLAAYESSPEFLEDARPEIAPEEGEDLEGRRVGAWRLVREIGRGGMGIVWEAVRDDGEYQQRAAIKLLPPGLLSAADVARFREERQILAGLNHPGIARLLDGGAGADGSPYLVMEYIEGERLDVWLEKQARPLADRLRLFLSICTAVEYAHRRLVIHRDLKPANILVAPDGGVRLLDFGIARLLDPDGVARQGRSGTVRHLTPLYASPEQVRGEAVTTATDIYSLGVVLYWLLAGQPPYRCDPDDTLAMMKAICEEDPAPASTVAAGGARQLRGDLDAIVLQALRKDPEQRYGSVRALADDVAAWLDGRPVAAHAQPLWARGLRYIRRHKSQSAAVCGVLASLVAGFMVSLWYARDAERERRIAEERFQDGRQLAHAVVFDLYESIAHLPGSTQARQILVERAIRYLRELEASGPASRDLQVELAGAYARIGDVQGNPTQAHLGDTKAAVASEREARRLALAVLRSHPGDAAAEAILADADKRLIDLSEVQGESEDWRALWRESIEIRRRQAVAHADAPAVSAALEAMEAYRLRREQKWSEALDAYRRAASLYEAALSKEPRDPDLGDRLSTTYHQMARCWKELNRPDEALAAYHSALRLDEARLAGSTTDTDAQTDVSFDLVEAGWIEYRLGRYQQAIADYERALTIQERLSAADPQDMRMRLEAAKLRNTAAPAYEAAGRRDEAIRILRTAGNRLEEALAADPENEDTRLHVGWVWCNLGDVYRRAAGAAESEEASRGQWTNAEWCYGRVSATLAKLKGRGRPDLDIDPRPMLTRAESGLAVCRKHLDLLDQP